MPANPPITSGLVLWLTAETGVTQGSDNRVSRWQDALTGSLYADEILSSARPLWVADAFPGHPGIRFDGQDGLFIEAGELGQNNFTLIALGRASGQRTSGGAASSGQHFLFSHTPTAPYPAVSVAANGLGIYEFSGGAELRCEAVTDAAVLCPLVVRYAGNAPSAFLNGELVCEASSSGTHSIPHGLGGSFIGDIAEILIYNRALTEQERLLIETYLQAKYDCFSGSSSSSDSSESSGSSESSDSSGDGGGSSGSSSDNSSDSSSSESSDSSGSESSDSSGGGGGGSSESGSSDSSSSESSDSSESSEDSSSSSSVQASSSSGGPSLYFDQDPVYVDWNDTDYDASGNLVTNHSPISWSISEGEATINDDGVVTFGTIGEETTVTASGSPYDSMTLTIIKAAVQKVEFTSAHTGGDGALLIDYDTDFAGNSDSFFDFRGWVKPDDNDEEGKNYPITHTQGTKVSVTVTVKIEPANLNFVLSGTPDVTGLSFTSTSETSTGDAQDVTLTSDDKLESKVQVISDASIEWSLVAQDYNISAGTSGPHKIFVTWSNPVTDLDVDQPPEPDNDEVPTQNYENKLTLKRAHWICEKASGATTEKDVVDKLHEALADAAKPHGSLVAQPAWSILDGELADCDDHARLLILACALHGITTISARYIFASRGDDCTFPDTQDREEGGLTVRRWLFLKPADAVDPRGYDNYQGVALYEDMYYSVTPKFKVDNSVDALKELNENGYADTQEWVKILPRQLIPWKGRQAGEWIPEGSAPFPWEQ